MYNPKLGIFGNLDRISKQLSRTQVNVSNNEVKATEGINESEDASVELASIVSDLMDAVTELAEMIPQEEE